MATMPIQGNDTMATRGNVRNKIIRFIRSTAMWAMRTLNNGVLFFTAIREVQQYAHSRISSVVEKLPMILAMALSSTLVGISTYNTFPVIDTGVSLEWLRLAAAIAGGLTFDVVLTSTVFARRKSGFSFLTVTAALIVALLIALDLYLKWGQRWLHATPIVMTVLYSLHIATTRGKPVQLLERQISALEQELSKTLEQLAQERLDSRLIEHDQEQTIRTLETQVATMQSVLEQLNAPKIIVDKEYHCTNCNHSLDNSGQVLASRRWGYCKHCKKGV